MDHPGPNTPRRSLKEQMNSTTELLRTLRSPNASYNSSQNSGKKSFTSPPMTQREIDDLEYNSQPVRRPSPTRGRLARNQDHRMSMYSIHGELTYQRDAEKQLISTIYQAKKDLRGDLLLVLLERVCTQAIALYNNVEEETLPDVDALCVGLSDYTRQYVEKFMYESELASQNLQPPTMTAATTASPILGRSPRESPRESPRDAVNRDVREDRRRSRIIYDFEDRFADSELDTSDFVPKSRTEGGRMRRSASRAEVRGNDSLERSLSFAGNDSRHNDVLREVSGDSPSTTRPLEPRGGDRDHFISDYAKGSARYDSDDSGRYEDHVEATQFKQDPRPSRPETKVEEKPRISPEAKTGPKLEKVTPLEPKPQHTGFAPPDASALDVRPPKLDRSTVRHESSGPGSSKPDSSGQEGPRSASRIAAPETEKSERRSSSRQQSQQSARTEKRPESRSKPDGRTSTLKRNTKAPEVRSPSRMQQVIDKLRSRQ